MTIINHFYTHVQLCKYRISYYYESVTNKVTTQLKKKKCPPTTLIFLDRQHSIFLKLATKITYNSTICATILNDIKLISTRRQIADGHRAVCTIYNFCLMAVEENVNDIDVEDIAKMKSDLLVKKLFTIFFFNSYFILFFIKFNI